MKNETDATAEYNYKEGEKYKQKKTIHKRYKLIYKKNRKNTNNINTNYKYKD